MTELKHRDPAKYEKLKACIRTNMAMDYGEPLPKNLRTLIEQRGAVVLSQLLKLTGIYQVSGPNQPKCNQIV
jgi:hypothetical protein